MFGGGKVKLDKNLIKRAKEYATQEGYASLEEFISHLIEREISGSDTYDESEEEIKKRLEGLGYIS